MLLGEVDLNGNAVNRESAADYSYVSNQSDGNEDNGLIATAGKLVPVDRAGDKIDEANEVSKYSCYCFHDAWPLDYSLVLDNFSPPQSTTILARSHILENLYCYSMRSKYLTAY